MIDTSKYTIKRDQEDSNALNYEFLLNEGMRLAGEYSGKTWTNFNHSDPGVTILQNLCYALTELGYKTELPIADLITQKNGEINYKNQFFLPEKALTTSPVLLKDFRKLVLNEFSFIKQIYFQSYPIGTDSYWIQPLVEIKPISTRIHGTKELTKQLDILLTRYTKLGNIFSPSVCLQQLEISLVGNIYLNDDADVEEAIADMIYEINNFYSAFPVYQSYEKLIKGGENPADLFEGPFLSNGYIADNCLSEKREFLKIEDVAETLLKVEGIAYVEAMKFKNSETPEYLKLGNRMAPFMSLDPLMSEFRELKLYKYGKLIAQFEYDKVPQYFNQLVSKQKYQNLSTLLPEGKYQNVEDYYSFQNQFPSVYQLTNINSKDPSRNAQTLQLKGYLMFFDQMIADHLSQLDHLPDLFSFLSGRNTSQVSSRTYYEQPIYNVPGAKYLLKDAEVYKTSIKSSGDANENWNLYQQDHQNPYYQTLTKAKISNKENQERKSYILKHLLARVGQNYPYESLYYTNPEYGTRESDIIDQVSRALFNFEEYSANKIRGYYKAEKSKKFVSGFERLLDQNIGLTSYIRGVIEKLSHGIEQNEPSVMISLNKRVIQGEDTELSELNVEEKKSNLKSVEVFYGGKPELSFEFNNKKSEALITEKSVKKAVFNRLSLLNTLITELEGFVLIDHARLLKVLQLSVALGEVRSESFDFETFTRIVLGLTSGDAVKAKKVEEVFQITIYVQDNTYILFNNVADDKTVKKLFSQLRLLRKGEDNELEFYAGTAHEKVCFDPAILHSVSAFFPDWVCMIHEPAFQQYLVNEMALISPAYLKVNPILLEAGEMQILLVEYRRWIKVIKAEYDLKKYHISISVKQHLATTAMLILKDFII